MKALIVFAYVMAAAMALHVAIIGIHIAERSAVWATSEIIALRSTGRETPP